MRYVVDASFLNQNISLYEWSRNRTNTCSNRHFDLSNFELERHNGAQVFALQVLLPLLSSSRAVLTVMFAPTPDSRSLHYSSTH